MRGVDDQSVVLPNFFMTNEAAATTWPWRRIATPDGSRFAETEFAPWSGHGLIEMGIVQDDARCCLGFRSLKEECVWQHNFGDFAEARSASTNWIHWYNAARPHQVLGCRSLHQFRGLQPKLVV